MNFTSSDVANDDTAGSAAATGLPGIRSWRRVYWLVVIVFALYVILLTALSKAFA